MDIAKEKLEELKKRYPSGIYEGEIIFNDEEDQLHTVEFLYRKPTVADVERYQKTAQKSPLVANSNIIQSLIVYPEPGPIIEKIKDYPIAYGLFVDNAIVPFFGASVQIRKRKL